MPHDPIGAGRLVPATAIDYARASKNLAWLVEIPLHLARSILADCYGFGDVHELQSVLAQGAAARQFSAQFEPPRRRPAFYQNDLQSESQSPNRLSALTARELRLFRAVQSTQDAREEPTGRMRRRLYCVLDAAFFSAPEVNRKHFAAVKAGILAMEGTALERERYLECQWPPGFWSYLEADCQLHFDARAGLEELKSNSLYFTPEEIVGIADIFHATAAHRAPAVFLAMAGEEPEPMLEGMPEIIDDYFDETELPSLDNAGPGLFQEYDVDDWCSTISDCLPPDAQDELFNELARMNPQDVATAPPPGTPPQLVAIARKWRLHFLRSQCRLHVESADNDRFVAMVDCVGWPDRAANDKTPDQTGLWGQGPFLCSYLEFEEVGRYENSDCSREVWSFKALLTRSCDGEPEDVVGYMAGWVVAPLRGQYVCDAGELQTFAWDQSDMLGEGVNAFLKSFLAYEGSPDLLSFVNARFFNSVVISEIVLRPKYRKQDLVPLALSTVANVIHNAPYSEYACGWEDTADFDNDHPCDDLYEHEIFGFCAPSVFMVPTPRSAKALRRYLMGLEIPENALMEEYDMELFAYGVDNQPGAAL